MADKWAESWIPPMYQVVCDRDGWVNPRRHRNPRSLQIGDGDGDGDVGSTSKIPSSSSKPLRRSTLVATRSRNFLRGGHDPYSRSGPSTAAPPSPPIIGKPDICRWGNIIGRHAAPSISSSPMLASDVASNPLPHDLDLASTISDSLGHGLAGRVEETSSPEQAEVGRNVDEETCSPVSPVASLSICTADQALWNKCVAEADESVDKIFPSSDRG